jgi:hypothetical protein
LFAQLAGVSPAAMWAIIVTLGLRGQHKNNKTLLITITINNKTRSP